MKICHVCHGNGYLRKTVLKPSIWCGDHKDIDIVVSEIEQCDKCKSTGELPDEKDFNFLDLNKGEREWV